MSVNCLFHTEYQTNRYISFNYKRTFIKESRNNNSILIKLIQFTLFGKVLVVKQFCSNRKMESKLDLY